MLKIAIVVGSTRPGRKADAVARWVFEIAEKRGDALFDIVDIADYKLPILDELVPPVMADGKYAHEHTNTWSAKIDSFDAFVFVTPEYNHGISGALKNALDFLYPEWNNKAAGFVAYGGTGGIRAVEQLRLVAAELRIATVRDQVVLTLREDFKNFTVFTPRAHQAKAVNVMIDDLISWGGALQTLRKIPSAATR